MRYLLLFLGLTLLAACANDKNDTGQRLDFVGTTRLTSSNRTGLSPADTLASRVYAEATDARQILTRLRITVAYTPRRNPFLYPTPVSSLVRDLIDNNPDPTFIYLDTLLTNNAQNFLFTSVFGVRTTTGSERWQYELLDPSENVVASRAFRLSMRRADSLLIYNEYTLRLGVPATGPAARRFLHLLPGLALPAYTVLSVSNQLSSQQAALQDSTDLIVQPDGLTIAAPDAATLVLNSTRWPSTRRRATRIYLTGLTATAFASQTTSAAIANIYTSAAATATTPGTLVGPVQATQIYVFQTGGRIPRYGLMQVLSVPTSTTTTTTAGLQLVVRMAK
ncbi:MAG: hypothetical protein ACRYG7_39910 [Janthinobacterium lividum]